MSTYQLQARAKAEKFVADALEMWKDLNGPGLDTWLSDQFSPKATNGAMYERLADKFPDLYDKLSLAEIEVRHRPAI